MSHRTLSLVGLACLPLLGYLFAGCGDPNAGRLFADIQWASRCENDRGCEGPGFREVCGFTGSDPCDGQTEEATLTCSISQRDGGDYSLSFTARQGNDVSLSISQLIFSSEGGGGGGPGCTVTYTERAISESLTFRGACASNTPVRGLPCQITNMAVYDDMGVPTVEGDLFCEFLELVGSPSITRELTAIGNRPEDANTAGSFRFANCDGLEF